MRIAMLSVHTCPLAMLGGKETGGMNVYVRDLTRELVRRGIGVDVFTRSQDPTVPSVNRSLGDQGRVIHLPAGPERPYDKYKVFENLPQFVDGVLAFAERDGARYDLIHSHYWLSGWVAQKLKPAWDIPVVQMFHTLAHLKNSIARSAEEREPLVRSDTESQVMRWADRITAASILEREQLIRLYGADPNKIEVIPVGVDTELFRPIPIEEARSRLGVKPCQKMILFVGRIEPLKGIDTLLQAFRLLAQQQPSLPDDVCLAIIGGNGGEDAARMSVEEERLRRLREDLGLGCMVTFLGSQAQDTLPNYYSAAEMVVMPSHYESFGMVAMEAMACGTPVIASKVGGLAYTVRDGITGYLVPDSNAEALAERIQRLLRTPGLRDKLGRQGHEWAQRFNWGCVADQIVLLYQDVISECAVERVQAAAPCCSRCGCGCSGSADRATRD